MPLCTTPDRSGHAAITKPSSIHFMLPALMLAIAGAACDDVTPAEERGGLVGVSEQSVSSALLQSRSNAIKSVHASHASIHNPLIFAGIAYTETQMAHCYSEYYNQVSSYVCAGSYSSDCGGSVTAGYWDGACSLQGGGLGMWQFDEGNHTQTLNKWNTSGYWNGQTHNILSVSGSTSAAIDFILFKAWYSSYTPYFSSYQAMYNWINSIRPVNGNSDYETWLGFLANSYNGQVWGSSGWSTTKEKYRTSTAYVYSAMGGSTYWYSTTTLPSCGSGLYCSVGAVTGASQCLSGSQALYCCPSGQTIVNGVCTSSTPPPCGSGLYCSGGPIPGASACLSGSQTVYCCAPGHTIINGACSP